MSVKQAVWVAIDWLDREAVNEQSWPEREDEDIHDILAEAGLAFDLRSEERNQ
jgi:hypothetical protein